MAETNEKKMPPIDKAYPNEIKEAAARNARSTPYPGAENGPADAYRHMLGIAEFRRRTNHPAARVAGNWNERDDVPWRLKTDADSQMDLHNNRIGERIGRVARKVMQDRIYTRSGHPRQAETFEIVRKHFEHRYPAPVRGRPRTQCSGGGPVQVDAYTRSDGTHLTTHYRSAPGPR